MGPGGTQGLACRRRGRPTDRAGAVRAPPGCVWGTPWPMLDGCRPLLRWLSPSSERTATDRVGPRQVRPGSSTPVASRCRATWRATAFRSALAVGRLGPTPSRRPHAAATPTSSARTELLSSDGARHPGHGRGWSRWSAVRRSSTGPCSSSRSERCRRPPLGWAHVRPLCLQPASRGPHRGVRGRRQPGARAAGARLQRGADQGGLRRRRAAALEGRRRAASRPSASCGC